jgi:hypothetical protein
MHHPNKHGVFEDAEKIDIGSVAGWSHAIIEIALAADGRWRSGFNFSNRGAGVSNGAAVNYSPTHATRQEAIDYQTANARDYFTRRLKDADEGCYVADKVRKDALFILAQIDARTTPRQMEMF